MSHVVFAVPCRLGVVALAIVAGLLGATNWASPAAHAAQASAKAPSIERASSAAKRKLRICTRQRRRNCVKRPKGAGRPHGNQTGSAGPRISVDAAADGLGAAPGQRESGALAWAMAQQGRRDYSGWCLKFTAHAYGQPAAGYASAIIAARALGTRDGGASAARAPAGTLVFFAATSGNPYGHVGLSLGDGRMISAETGTVRVASIDKTPYWRKLYIGWNYAPANWPGRIPPPPSLPAPGAPSPSSASSVAFAAPEASSSLSGTVKISATLTNASGVQFDAYYATNPNDINTVGWHRVGSDTNGADGWSVEWDTRSVPDQGNAGWGTVNIAAIALDRGAATATRAYRRVNINNAAPPSQASPPNRTAITSYNRMQPGAPYNGVFKYAWQPFVAQSNTITTLGATVGKGGYGGELTTLIRLCSNQPDANGNCNVLGQTAPTVVNFGNTQGDIGDVAVSPGATYWIEYFPPQPYGNGWVTYWWAGGSTVSSSDQMQAIVLGYNR